MLANNSKLKTGRFVCLALWLPTGVSPSRTEKSPRGDVRTYLSQRDVNGMPRMGGVALDPEMFWFSVQDS